MSDLGRAIKAAYEGRLTQQQLADAIGVSQATISGWVRGRSGERPSLERIGQIEDACQRPRGWVLVNAGLVEEHTTVEAAIAMDARLNADGQGMLLAAYQALIDRV